MGEALSPPPDEGLWDYDDPAGSEARLSERLAALAEPALRAELLTQIARAQGLQRRFDAGHRTLDAVAAQRAHLPPRAASRYALERGRLHRSAGQPDAARPLFLEAWQVASDHGEVAEAIDAAHMLALVAAPGQQLEWNLQALDLAERTADPRGRRWVGPLRNNIGWAYHEQGAFAQALDQFERALSWREQQGRPRETRVARWCVGRALRSLGRVEEALALQRDLRAQAALAGELDGYVEEELGELLLGAAGPEAARPHFASAYRLLAQDAWLSAHEPERLSRLSRLGGPAGAPEPA